MSRRLVIGIAILLIVFVLLQGLAVRLLKLDEHWRILEIPYLAYLLFAAVSMLLVLLVLLVSRGIGLWMRRHIGGLSVRGKLMWALGLLSTLPVILLVLLAYWVMMSSIETWTDQKTVLALEEVDKISATINQYQIDTMALYAEQFTYEEKLQRRLMANGSVRSLGEKFAQELDQYELGIYGRYGRREFATDPLFLPEHISGLGIEIDQLKRHDDLSVDGRLNPPIVTGEADIENTGLLFSAVPVFPTVGPMREPVGSVVVAWAFPLTNAERNMIREKAARIRERISAGQLNYRNVHAGKPQARRLLAAGLVISSILVLGVALWVSSALSKSISQPIHALVEGTHHVARGDLNYKVEVPSRDEFALLARSFNQMMSELQRAVEERQRAEQLAVWRDVARKMAHEIKNPLTPIQLSAQRLRRRYHRNSEGFEEVLEQCTATIEREVESARRWLDEFSQLARMPTPEPHSLDVCRVLQEALDAVPVWPEGVVCETNWPERGVSLQADGEQLRRAFFNLIKNALESMNGEGRLHIDVREDRRRGLVIVQIGDTGPGVPPDVLPKLFVPHFSTKREGMGLGLAIVKKIVDDHRGEIEVEVGEDAPGTRFRITLPVQGRRPHLEGNE